jgi:RNA polymerase sigma factor (sigma-70 family)
MENKITYEEKYHELEELLCRNRARWQLDAISWMDYDDVCQMIRLHIFKKWHLWDQDRPFKPWASQIISNQMKNMVRNNYSNYAKPCLKCPHYMPSDGCTFTKSGVQDKECKLFAKWKQKKERAYNLKLPLPIEEGVSLGETSLEDHFDYEKAQARLHELIMDKLNEKHKKIYYMLYIEHKSEEEVAQAFKFKADTSKRKTVRHKQISNLHKKFYLIAISVLKNNDIL